MRAAAGLQGWEKKRGRAAASGGRKVKEGEGRRVTGREE
jgi:hypothetical protein